MPKQGKQYPRCGQRQRHAEQREHTEDHGDVTPPRCWRTARKAVGRQHEKDDQGGARVRGMFAGIDQSRPSPGPTVRSSMTVSGAGKAPARNRIEGSSACWTVKLPEISRSRRGSVLGSPAPKSPFVENDGEWLADVLLGRLGKLARAGRVEAEADDRLAVALVKAGLGVNEIGPRTRTRFSMRYFWPPSPSRSSESGGGRLAIACSAVID